MTMEGYLDERDRTAGAAQHQDRRDAGTAAWFNKDEAPEVRLLKFDAWARRQLAKRLDWTWAGAAKEKRIEQCRVQLNTMVRHLFKRGWMLDGKRLGDRVIELLDAVGAAQRKGNVRDFWSYFKASVSRYVGANAEELRDEAMQAGMHAGQVFESLAKGLPRGPSVPELEAQRTQETLTAKLARQRRQNSRKTADAAQLPLL